VRELQLPDDCVELFARALHADGAKPGEDGKLPLPKWVHLTPAGDEGHDLALKGERVVRGRDGREFAIGDIARVLAGTELPMQFDWDHESVMGGWFGPSSTKAAGWIGEVVYLEKGDDERPEPGFWGRVERWTPDGRASVEDGYYRGLSPVVRYERREPVEEGGEAPPPALIGFVSEATSLPGAFWGLVVLVLVDTALDRVGSAVKGGEYQTVLVDSTTGDEIAHEFDSGEVERLVRDCVWQDMGEGFLARPAA
jgi:hypothetical protein